MNKDERLNLKSILMINALVKFNLIPPQNSEEWIKWRDRYESISIHLCPLENFETASLKRIMQLVSQSSHAKSPLAKLNIYKEICELTGFAIEQVACPILQTFTTLSGLCSYTLFKNPEYNQNTAKHLVVGIKEWCQFYDALPKFYLWDTHNDKELTSASTVAAAFCLELQSIISDEVQLSCLYALAKVLERNDYIQALDEMNINAEHIPDKLKTLYATLLSSREINQKNNQNKVMV